MRKNARPFTGVAIEGASELVNLNGWIINPARVEVEARNARHCVALWSLTVHSYDVRVDSNAKAPLYYPDHGQAVAAERLHVEPPIKRDFERQRPASGRSSLLFVVSATAQDPRNGTVAHAELETRLRVVGLYERGTSGCIELPEEPAYVGIMRTSCGVG
jgi:hypothetical protein